MNMKRSMDFCDDEEGKFEYTFVLQSFCKGKQLQIPGPLRSLKG